MTLPAVLSPEAEADLDDAATWRERQSEALGKELVAQVRNALVRVENKRDAFKLALKMSRQRVGLRFLEAHPQPSWPFV